MITGYENPKFLNQFILLQKEGANLFNFYGADLLIERLVQGERKTRGGIILASDADQLIGTVVDRNSMIGIVCLVGSGVESGGFTFETGQIVILPEYSGVGYNAFPGIQSITANTLYRAPSSEVKMVWPSIEAFNKYTTLMA